MAKPSDITPAQEAAIRSKLGLAPDSDLTNIYSAMSEDGIRRLATVPATPKPSAAPKPAAPKAAPKPAITPTAAPTTPAKPTPQPVTIQLVRDPVSGRITTEAGARMASDFNAQVQPEGMEPRRTPATATTGQEAIDKALEQRRRDVVARSYTGEPSMRLSAEEAKAEMDKGRAIATAPRTSTGERRPLTPEPSAVRRVFAGTPLGDTIVTDVLEGIMPQTIETAEQKRQRDREAYKATQDFFKSFSPNTPPSGEDFKKVYESYRYYGGKDPEGFMARVMKRSGLDEPARAAFTSRTPTGAVIESPLTTVGKALSTSEAVVGSLAAATGRGIGYATARATGTPEAALPDINFRETLRENIAAGTGLMGAGSEAFTRAAEYAGADKDTQEFIGNVGGALGFVAGIGIPLDLGVVQGVSTGARTAAAASTIGKEFGVPTRGFAGGFREGLFDAYRITGQRTGGLNTVSRELERATSDWLNNPRVVDVSSVTVRLAADDAVQAAVVADREAGKAAVEARSTYNQTPYINALRQRFDDIKAAEVAAGTNHPITRYANFDEWAEAAERTGVDIYNSAGQRAYTLGQPPPNVRIKEVEESVRRTRTAGNPSVDYFDDVATGGRSNLYYDAFIDSMDVGLRNKLLAGGSVKSEEFLAAVDDYINNIRIAGERAGKTEAEISRIIDSVETAIKSRGIKLPAGRITGGALPATALTTRTAAPSKLVKGGLILTPEIESALAKSYRIDLGRRLLNDFAGRTGITGKQLRVGNIVLSEADATAVRKNIKDNKLLNSLRERLKKNNGDAIDVSPEEVSQLKQYFITPFTKTEAMGLPATASASVTGGRIGLNIEPTFIRPTRTYSPFQSAPIIGRIEASGGKLSATQYNDLIRAAIALEASPKISAKSTEEVGKIVATLQGAGDKAAELSYFVRNVMTPRDLQEAGLAAIMIDKTKKVFEPPPTKNPVANNVISEVNDRFGNLGERFKAKMRKKMNVPEEVNGVVRPPVDRPTAFAETIVEEFTKEGTYKSSLTITPKRTATTGEEILEGGVVQPMPTKQKVFVQKPFEAAPSGAPLGLGEKLFKEKMGAYELYRSYVASIYGGYEQAIDAIATTGRTLELDKMAIATNEMRNLVTVLMHTEGTIFNKRFIQFAEAVRNGDSVTALNTLQRLHVELSGYSIQQAMTRLSGISEDAIEGALKAGTDNANKGIISFGMENYIGNDLAFYSGGFSRGIDESYKAASQQAPLFLPTNFKEILVGNYYLRAQANVVDDVLLKASIDYPELFPNASLLLQIAEDDWATVRAGILKALDEDLASGTLTDTQSAIYQALRYDIVDTGEVIPQTFGRQAVKSARGAQLSQDLLISAIEDRVAAVSGGGGVSQRYLQTAYEYFSEGYEGAQKTAIKQLLKKGLDRLESKPASVYGAIFDSQARADATTLFYQTSLTNIKNQLKSPFAPSVQGVAEKVGTIPLLQQAQASLKKPLFNAVNIKRTTETIQALQMSTAASKLDQVVAADGTKLSDEITKMERTLDGIISNEISPELIALAAKKESVLKDLAKQSGDIQARRVILDTIGTVYDNGSNIAKNGLLGGLILPNLNYHVVNALTAPSIIASTVGLRNVGVALPFFGEKGLVDVMKYAYSKGTANIPGWKLPSNKVLFTTPDGTVWTTEMLSKLVTDGSIGKSQSVAELTNSLLSSTIDWAGRTGFYGDTAKGAGIGRVPAGFKVGGRNIPTVPFSSGARDTALKAMRRNFFNVYDMNMFTTAANAIDQTFRMGVIMKALREGEPLENALRLGREALFDYGSLNSVNEAIAKAVWFYRFKINNYASVFTSLATDPKALKLAFASGQGWEYVYGIGERTLGLEKEDIDMRYVLKDYSESRIFLDLVEDPENKKRYGIYGPPTPNIQAVAEMTDYASMLLTPAILALRGEKEIGTASVESLSAFAQIAIENANPFVQGVVLAGTGKDIRRGGQKASDYLDPKLIWYMQQNPEQWYTFTTYFNIEEVPFDEEKPAVGYYNGRQWRIKKGDEKAAKNWNVWQSGLLAIGVGRTMRDYASIFANLGYAGQVVSGAAGTVFTAGAVPARLPQPAKGKTELPITLDVGDGAIDFWRSAGVITVQDAPLLEEVQRTNRLKAAGEIKATAVQKPK